MSDDEQRKETVEIGSGDFQNNPIFGDAPQSIRSTYVDEPNAAAPAQSYNYPAQPNQQYGGDDGDNPFQANQYAAQQADNEYQANEYQQQNAPPAYEQQPPPAPAYADTTPQNDYNEEPEDVVAQMNHNQMPQDDDVDYGVTQPKVDEEAAGDDSENGAGLMGNFFVRTVWMASSLLFASMMAMGMFTSTKNLTDEFKTGYGLSAFAAFMLFFGAIAALVFAIMTKLNKPIPAEKIVLWVIIAFYLVGGVFYFMGGCAVAYAWNTFDAHYIAGVFFAEQTFVGFHAILAGLDLWRRRYLNSKKVRVLVYNGLFFFVSLVDFFAYAVTSTTFDNSGLDNAGPAWLALWYFIIMIVEVLFLIIYLIPVLNDKLGKPVVLFIIAVAFAVSAICLLIGYFIITGQFVGLTGRSYFLGIGFFIFSAATMIAFDMIFDRFIPGYKDGGNSLSDAEARGGAVPTDNPDSPRENETEAYS
eukprot:CAMPEP_0197022112 /NCGR_PEP_ID=MMETSP1384-20130603/3006_1 /TAXON_ID=29189 /ORGANISM="Ammonia sp." /LENGTH=471 /DNA_ID=CAMNT_0042450083 /DNA_START=109 /DNA_END=1527 /DNA_ORIENTATION=+